MRRAHSGNLWRTPTLSYDFKTKKRVHIAQPLSTLNSIHNSFIPSAFITKDANFGFLH